MHSHLSDNNTTNPNSGKWFTLSRSGKRRRTTCSLASMKVNVHRNGFSVTRLSEFPLYLVISSRVHLHKKTRVWWREKTWELLYITVINCCRWDGDLRDIMLSPVYAPQTNKEKENEEKKNSETNGCESVARLLVFTSAVILGHPGGTLSGDSRVEIVWITKYAHRTVTVRGTQRIGCRKYQQG